MGRRFKLSQRGGISNKKPQKGGVQDPKMAAARDAAAIECKRQAAASAAAPARTGDTVAATPMMQPPLAGQKRARPVDHDSQPSSKTRTRRAAGNGASPASGETTQAAPADECVAPSPMLQPQLHLLPPPQISRSTPVAAVAAASVLQPATKKAKPAAKKSVVPLPAAAMAPSHISH